MMAHLYCRRLEESTKSPILFRNRHEWLKTEQKRPFCSDNTGRPVEKSPIPLFHPPPRIGGEAQNRPFCARIAAGRLKLAQNRPFCAQMARRGTKKARNWRFRAFWAGKGPGISRGRPPGRAKPRWGWARLPWAEIPRGPGSHRGIREGWYGFRRRYNRERAPNWGIREGG